jgi:glycosyltransferase involved in cell wall biosynthesis
MILVSGNMYHLPNVDGVLYLLGEVLPHVLRRVPTARLFIVGSDPDERIRKAATRFEDRVVVTGRVPDVSEYLRRAVVSVCPVLLKIGVQTKVLEALAAGTPVVTTSAGNSGIAGVSGRDLWVEDEPEGFADRVVGLLRGDLWDSFSRDGLTVVSDRFSWQRSARQLESLIESVTGP